MRFDPEQLAKEALQFTAEDWSYHPLRHRGNAALALVSVDGKINDGFEGLMLPTPYPVRSPYAMQVMAMFQTVVGRSGFMRLSANADVPSHIRGFYLPVRVEAVQNMTPADTRAATWYEHKGTLLDEFVEFVETCRPELLHAEFCASAQSCFSR